MEYTLVKNQLQTSGEGEVYLHWSLVLQVHFIGTPRLYKKRRRGIANSHKLTIMLFMDKLSKMKEVRRD